MINIPVYMKLEIITNGYEFASKAVALVPYDGDISDSGAMFAAVGDYARDKAATFYGGDSAPDDYYGEGFSFNFGEIIVLVSVVEIITQDEYNVLNRFLSH